MMRSLLSPSFNWLFLLLSLISVQIIAVPHDLLTTDHINIVSELSTVFSTLYTMHEYGRVPDQFDVEDVALYKLFHQFSDGQDPALMAMFSDGYMTNEPSLESMTRLSTWIHAKIHSTSSPLLLDFCLVLIIAKPGCIQDPVTIFSHLIMNNDKSWSSLVSLLMIATRDDFMTPPDRDLVRTWFRRLIDRYPIDIDPIQIQIWHQVLDRTNTELIRDLIDEELSNSRPIIEIIRLFPCCNELGMLSGHELEVMIDRRLFHPSDRRLDAAVKFIRSDYSNSDPLWSHILDHVLPYQYIQFMKTFFIQYLAETERIRIRLERLPAESNHYKSMWKNWKLVGAQVMYQFMHRLDQGQFQTLLQFMDHVADVPEQTSSIMTFFLFKWMSIHHPLQLPAHPSPASPLVTLLEAATMGRDPSRSRTGSNSYRDVRDRRYVNEAGFRRNLYQFVCWSAKHVSPDTHLQTVLRHGKSLPVMIIEHVLWPLNPEYHLDLLLDVTRAMPAHLINVTNTDPVTLAQSLNQYVATTSLVQEMEDALFRCCQSCSICARPVAGNYQMLALLLRYREIQSRSPCGHIAHTGCLERADALCRDCNDL